MSSEPTDRNPACGTCCCCAGGKAEALAGLGQGLLQPFHAKRFEAGHGATDFAQWTTSEEPYSVQYRVVRCCCQIIIK